jgi:predicted Fe-Mo cluster-binding NifX family protein
LRKKAKFFKFDEHMKVAIFLKNNELTVLHEEKVHVVIFNIEKDKVIGVENTILEEQNKESIVSWLYHQSINQIYLSEIDEQIHHKINSQGIRVKTLETLKNDKLYNSLALSSHKF